MQFRVDGGDVIGRRINAGVDDLIADELLPLLFLRFPVLFAKLGMLMPFTS